jgi:hypothetical protein
MFIKNDYAFFTQIVVFCFVHIYQFPRPVIHSKAIAKGEKSEMERYTLFVG